MLLGLVSCARLPHSAADHPARRMTSRIHARSSARCFAEIVPRPAMPAFWSNPAMQLTLQKSFDDDAKMHYQGTMLDDYLDQLEREARERGVDLAAACNRAGIATTTLQRWRKGEASPRKGTAELVLDTIRTMAGVSSNEAAD